jgi:hypothetical protein
MESINAMTSLAGIDLKGLNTWKAAIPAGRS